jgi:hypothetical protein
LIAVTDLAIVTVDRRTATADAAARRTHPARVLHATGAVGLVLTGTALLAGY